MSWVIAIAGFCALVVLHEAGHFAAAKACGMRVERFSLFFPPTVASFKRGETEYAIGAIPAGGYVKITGMSPDELRSVDLRVAHRAYYMQPPWKRIVVIVAGPAVNLVIAFLLFAAVLWSGSLGGASTISQIAPAVQTTQPAAIVGAIVRGTPAAAALQVGDRIVAIDGRARSVNGIVSTIKADRCAGPLVNGCRAARPLAVTLSRRGLRRVTEVYPRYFNSGRRMEIGFEFAAAPRRFGVLAALTTSAAAMWSISESTVTHVVHALTSAKVRSQLHSVVGITIYVQEAVSTGWAYGVVLIAFVSLVLGVMNLFPFLPLDGGHVTWSLAEKLRGKRVSLTTMWRFSSVGIVLLLFLVASGISNDIGRLAGGN